jgi:hypothetical protein
MRLRLNEQRRTFTQALLTGLGLFLCSGAAIAVPNDTLSVVVRVHDYAAFHQRV